MEQFRRKRSQSARAPSKVTEIVNRSSDDKLIASDEPYRGSNQTARHKYPKLESDSRSCDCDMIMDKHRTAFESGQRTSKLPAGTPMKSLLADEMSKETEYTKRAPGVIAKLMGLDGMPSQKSFYKQPKRSSYGFHQKTVSAGSLRHQKACNNQLCKRIAREQYKDVYEVGKCSRDRTACCKSQMPPNMTHAEDEMAIIRQKFRDAKRLSTDEKLHNSKEFHGGTEITYPNNYLFLKFLGEPDSLLAKHLHNLRASRESRCEHVRNLKASNIMSSKFNAIGHLTDIKASNKIDISFSHECQVGLHHPVSRKGKASDLDKSATVRPGVNELASDAQTKIVLLKPNLEGSRKSAKFSSSSSSCELLSDRDTHNSGGSKRLPTLDISCHKSRESKELAKEITRQMRNKLGETSFNVPLSGYRGYSADESSHEVSGNDSSYESYAKFLTSRTSGCPSFRRKSSASRYAESSVSKEAKKRLSERWKMSHRYEEFSLGAKGSTLGQMLSIYGTDVRLPNLDGEMTNDKFLSSLNRNSKLSGAVEPLGISSKDGWRGGCSGTLSGPETLRTAYDRIGNPDTCVRNGACGTERFLIPKEGYNNGRNGRKNGVKKDFSSSTGNLSLRGNKVNDAQGSQERRKGKKSTAEAKNSLVHEPVVLESPTCRLDTMLTLDSETVSEHVIIPGRMVSGDNVMPASEFICLQVKNDSSSSGLHGITQEQSKTCRIDSSQYCGAQPESPASNKEADHPSPVSVLDTPFVEDLSSGSECFERVSAELRGLRMQLQLLKMETGAASTLISSDEDEGSPCFSEAAKPCAENWEASYMADMLSDYEFDDTDPNSFMATWHSPECPVGPHVFEKLEKKYSYPITSCSRSDRRLLFDHINSSILETGQRITDPHPSVKPSKAWFEAELCKLLEVAMKLEKEDVADDEMVFLQSKSEWMNLGKCIEDIGCDIGKMLLDELVCEALAI